MRLTKRCHLQRNHGEGAPLRDHSLLFDSGAGDL